MTTLHEKAKTGQQIHDFIKTHSEVDCPKNCLWVKLSDVEALLSDSKSETEKIMEDKEKVGFCRGGD